MNTKQAREYGKKAVIFEEYIYEITSEGCEDVFIGSDSEEVKTALETFGEGVDPDAVLGLYTLDGGEEGMLFTTDGIVAYFPSVAEEDSMFSDDDDEDDEIDVQYDYCFSFRYVDVRLTLTQDYTERKRRKTNDCELTLEIDLKDGSEINFDYSMFDKTPMKEFIDEMIELDKELNPPKANAETEEIKNGPGPQNSVSDMEYLFKYFLLQSFHSKAKAEQYKDADYHKKNIPSIYDFTMEQISKSEEAGGWFFSAGSKEAMTAVKRFGKGIKPETVLGVLSNDGGESGILLTTKSIILADKRYDGTYDECYRFDYADVEGVRRETKTYKKDYLTYVIVSLWGKDETCVHDRLIPHNTYLDSESIVEYIELMAAVEQYPPDYMIKMPGTVKENA